MSNPEPKSIRESVMETIQKGEVQMRPKWHFILKSTLMISGTVIASLTLIYLISFILFILRQTGIIYAPSFGFNGVKEFLVSLPWVLIFISVVFVLALELLVQHYSFAYRSPLLFTLAGIILFTLVGGFVVAQTSLHELLLSQAKENRLGIVSPFYKEYNRPNLSTIHKGCIRDITEFGFIMENVREEELRIHLSPATHISFVSPIIKGDCVVVFGKRQDEEVDAVGVRKLEEKATDIIFIRPTLEYSIQFN